MSADLRIDEELAICEAATQWGVLKMHTYEDGTSSNRIFEHLTGRLIADNVDGPDATFIAHARTGYPLALRRIQELEKQLAAALAERDALAAKVDAAAKYIHELRSYPQTIHPKLHAAAVAYYELTPDTEAT